MASNVNLPEGFIVDNPLEGNILPEGFVMDQSSDAIDKKSGYDWNAHAQSVTDKYRTPITDTELSDMIRSKENSSGLPIGYGSYDRQKDQGMSFGGKLGTMISNAPKDAVGMIKGLADMVLHPVDTGVALATTGAGIVAGMVPESMRSEEIAQLAKSGEPFYNYMSNLGSHPVDTVAKGFIEHPVGSLMNAKGVAELSGLRDAVEISKLANPRNSKINIGGSIPTTLGEDLMNPAILQTERWMEEIPIAGLKSFRKAQNAAAESQAVSLLNNYIADPTNPTKWGNKAFVDSMYQDVRDAAQQHRIAVSGTKTLDAVNTVLDDMPKLAPSLHDPQIYKILQELKAGTEGGPTNVVPTYSFDDFWKLRKELGGLHENMIASRNYNGARKIKTVLEGVNEDMDAISNARGANGQPLLSDEVQLANDAYKKFIVKHDIVRKAYDIATGKVIRDSAGDAIESVGGTSQVFSPKKFSNELRNQMVKLQDRGSKLFNDREIETIAGNAHIMDTVKRSGEFMEDNANGLRGVRNAGIGGAVVGAFTAPLLTAKVLGSSMAAAVIGKFLTTTTAGKRMALSAAKMESTSPAFRNLLRQADAAALAEYQAGKIKPDESSDNSDPLNIRGAINGN